MKVNSNSYQIVNKIGEGGFSNVFSCLSLTDKKLYALKKVTLSGLASSVTKQVLNEISLLKKLKSSDKVIGLIDQ